MRTSDRQGRDNSAATEMSRDKRQRLTLTARGTRICDQLQPPQSSLSLRFQNPLASLCDSLQSPATHSEGHSGKKPGSGPSEVQILQSSAQVKINVVTPRLQTSRSRPGSSRLALDSSG